MCFDDGILQAYLDGEGPFAQNKEIEHHLASCPKCQEKLKQLKENQQFIKIHLVSYKKHLDRMEYPLTAPSRAYHQKKEGVFDMIFRYRKLACTIAGAACLGILFTFSPVRTVAAQFLTLFRVQNVETTAVSINDLEQIARAFNAQGVDLDLKNIGKVENKMSGKPHQVSLDEAKELIGYTPQLPDYLPDGIELEPKFSYGPENKIDFTLNIKNINKMVEKLGGGHLFPENLEGKTVSLLFPDSIVVSGDTEAGEDHRTISLVQTKSPEIRVPENVDLEEVRKAVLDLPVIPYEVKQKLASLDDWQHTLYIPQPSHGSTKNVKIGGSNGVALSEKWGNQEDVVLIWQDQGMFYSLEGVNVSEAELVKTAESLH